MTGEKYNERKSPAPSPRASSLSKSKSMCRRDSCIWSRYFVKQLNNWKNARFTLDRYQPEQTHAARCRYRLSSEVAHDGTSQSLP